MRQKIKEKKKRQTRTHNINSKTISGKNHTSIICQSSQPKKLTFTNARIQIMQHWMLTVDVLYTLQKLDTPRCYHCIQGCIVSSSTDKIHICTTYIDNV